jgi:SAM-dependent methyltransferase
VGGRPQPALDARRGRLGSALDRRSYDAFARFYDAVAAAGPEQADYVRGLIERHRPGARTVLELACGTGEILARLTKAGTETRWFGEGNLALIEVRDREDGGVVWDLSFFEQQGEARYVLHAVEIPEVAFPRARIEQSLRRRFRRVSVSDRRRKRPSVASERLYFVAIR